MRLRLRSWRRAWRAVGGHSRSNEGASRRGSQLFCYQGSCPCHAHARDLVGLFWGFSGVSTRVSSAESLRPSAARMSVSCAVNRGQNWATPWKSCEDERAAVSVIDEQTRLDTFAQSCKGGWRVGIASSSSGGGSSLGISLWPQGRSPGSGGVSSRVPSPWSHWA